MLITASTIALFHRRSASASIHGSAPTGPTGQVQFGSDDQADEGIYLYENLIKTSFSQVAAKPFIYPAVLDNNGYPNNAPSNTLSTAINAQMYVPSAWGTTTLAIAWSGVGGVAMNCAGGFSNFTIVSGTGITNQNSGTLIQILGTNVVLSFNFTTAPPAYPSPVPWGFPPGTYNGMSNLIFCRQSNLAAVQANNNLPNPDYVTLQKALNPWCRRPLDSSGVNNVPSSLFAQRAPQTAVAYPTGRFIPGNWAGSVSGTNTYTLSAPSGWPGLIDGACVQFYVPAAQVNTLTGASVTLNVAGTGAFQITDCAPNNLPGNYLLADDGTNTIVWTATYSAIYGYWTVDQGGLNTAVPLEQHIALANTLNQHLWYNISHRWPISDASAIASVVKANLNSWLNFYAESSNEVWNSEFFQTSFVGNIMVTLGSNVTGDGGLTNSYDGYALIARRMLGALTTAWGGATSPALVRVMGCWTADTQQNQNTHRLQGANLATVAQGGNIPNGTSLWTSYFGAPNYTTVGNQPIDYCDVIAIAPYGNGAYLPAFNTSWQFPPYSTNVSSLSSGGPSTGTNPAPWTTGVLGAADAYAAGGSTNIANALAFVDWDLRQGVFAGQAGSNTLQAYVGTSNGTGILVFWESVAAGYDARRTSAGQALLQINHYEGSMAPSGPTVGTCSAIGISTSYGGVGGKVDNLITGYKNSALFYALVNDIYQQMLGKQSGAPNYNLLPHCKHIAWYQTMGPSTWSVLDGDLYSGPSSLGGLFSGTPYQSWNALAAINN